MRRRTVHLIFGGVAFVCAAFTIFEAVKWRAAERTNAAIASAAPSSEVPEARFARAIAAGRRGQMDSALRDYKILARENDGTFGNARLGNAALLNAGNLYLREALKSGPDGSARTLPLVELAKQSYRTLLRRDPQAWDARYNLERALWLSPEIEQPVVETIKRDAEERVMSTLQGTRGELP